MSVKKLISSLAHLQASKEACDVKVWLAARKRIGAEIDPDQVSVRFEYAQVLDPYNVCPDFPEELYQIGREYFACSSDADPWVSFDDIPKPKVERLWQRMRAGHFDSPDSVIDWGGSAMPKRALEFANTHGLSPNKMLWDPKVSLLGAESVRGRLLVRSTTQSRGPLIIKGSDPAGALFLLNIQEGAQVRAGGWMNVDCAKHFPIFTANGTTAHFIQQSQLRGMDELQQFLSAGG